MSVPRILIACVILLYCFSSCKKENINGAGDRLLQRVVSRSGDSIGYLSYEYDAQRRLVAITDSSNHDGHIGTTLIKYDTAENPARFTDHGIYPGQPDREWAYLLVYQEGKVIQKLVSNSNNGSYVTENIYTYDMKGRLARDSAISWGYTNFVYDDNDNVVQMQKFYKAGGAMINSYNITASYDSNINPYNGLGLTLYFITDLYSVISKHNITQEIYNQYNSNHTGNYTYEYENSLPKMMTESWENAGLVAVSTVNFYYN
jgi:hypothetical protein